MIELAIGYVVIAALFFGFLAASEEKDTGKVSGLGVLLWISALWPLVLIAAVGLGFGRWLNDQ